MSLIVDLGQSGARIKTNNQVVQSSIAKQASESVVQTLERVFKEVPTQTHELVYLSLTGLMGDVGDVTPYGELCAKLFDAKRVFVMDDGIAAYLGALSRSNGVVLTLGGGVVAVSGNNGKFGHADGKGAIFGDFGGGFWVGQSGMRRAIATLDGRDDAPDLVEALKSELKQHQELQSKTGVEASALCITAAKTVIQAAEAGSKSALQILEQAAVYLGRTVCAAWDKVKEQNSSQPKIAFLGGLSKSDLYLKLIKTEINKSLDCEYVIAQSDHLTGAPLAAELFPNGAPPLFKIWQR